MLDTSQRMSEGCECLENKLETIREAITQIPESVAGKSTEKVRSSLQAFCAALQTYLDSLPGREPLQQDDPCAGLTGYALYQCLIDLFMLAVQEGELYVPKEFYLDEHAFDRMVLSYLAAHPEANLPFNVNPGDYSGTPCTSLVLSFWLYTGRLVVDNPDADPSQWTVAGQPLSGILSNQKLLDILGVGWPNPNLTAYMEPLWVTDQSADVYNRAEYRDRLKFGDAVFYVDLSLHPGGMYEHVAVVYGWGRAENPNRYYDTYQQAVDAGITDPKLYVVDRSNERNDSTPFLFEEYPSTGRAYSFWTEGEKPFKEEETITTAGYTSYLEIYDKPCGIPTGQRLLYGQFEIISDKWVEQGDNYKRTWYQVSRGWIGIYDAEADDKAVIRHPKPAQSANEPQDNGWDCLGSLAEGRQ